MKKQPLVSVGIPTYNRPEGLHRTLKCITKQTYKNLEIIVSDNCSPNPKVKEIVKKFQQQDKRIQYFRQIKNIYIDNFSFVLKKSTGEYFMWAADDDYWDLCYLQSCMEGFKKSKNIILSGSKCVLVDGKTSKQILVDPGISTVGLPAAKRFRRYKSILHGGKHVGGIFYGLYKRKVLRQTLPFNKIIGEDHIILAKLSLQGEFITTPKKLMVKRWGGASTSHKNHAKMIGINNKFKIKFPYLIREIILQKIIFKTDKLNLEEKIKLSCWSCINYLQLILNQQVINRFKRFLYFLMKLNKKIKELI